MSCSYTESGRGATTSGSVAIESGNENDLQSAVAYIGPVAVAVDAQSNAFRVSQCTTLSMSFQGFLIASNVYKTPQTILGKLPVYKSMTAVQHGD